MVKAVPFEERSPIGGRFSLCNPLVAPALIAGGVSLLGSLFGHKSTKDTNAQNMAIAQANNASQERIAAENNATQIQMMRENNEWSRQQAIDMFNLENEYNTPEAQRDRLIQAGINPAAVFGNTSGSVGTGDIATPSAAGSTISPSMPHFVTPTMQTPPSVLLGAVPAIAELAKASSDYQSGRKLGVEADKLGQLLDSQIKKALADVNNIDAETSYKRVLTYLERQFGGQKRYADIVNTYKQAYLAQMQGDNQEAQKNLAIAEEALTRSKKTRFDQETPLALNEMQESIKLLQEKQKTEKSAQTSNYASAANQRAQASLTDEQREQLRLMRDDNIAINKALRTGKELDNGKLAATYDSQVEYLKNQKLISDEKLKELHEIAERARKENSMYYWNFAFDKLERTAKAVAGFVPFASGGSSNPNVYTPMWSTSGTF